MYRCTCTPVSCPYRTFNLTGCATVYILNTHVQVYIHLPLGRKAESVEVEFDKGLPSEITPFVSSSLLGRQSLQVYNSISYSTCIVYSTVIDNTTRNNNYTYTASGSNSTNK